MGTPPTIEPSGSRWVGQHNLSRLLTESTGPARTSSKTFVALHKLINNGHRPRAAIRGFFSSWNGFQFVPHGFGVARNLQ